MSTGWPRTTVFTELNKMIPVQADKFFSDPTLNIANTAYSQARFLEWINSECDEQDRENIGRQLAKREKQVLLRGTNHSENDQRICDLHTEGHLIPDIMLPDIPEDGRRDLVNTSVNNLYDQVGMIRADDTDDENLKFIYSFLSVICAVTTMCRDKHEEDDWQFRSESCAKMIRAQETVDANPAINVFNFNWLLIKFTLDFMIDIDKSRNIDGTCSRGQECYNPTLYVDFNKATNNASVFPRNTTFATNCQRFILNVLFAYKGLGQITPTSIIENTTSWGGSFMVVNGTGVCKERILDQLARRCPLMMARYELTFKDSANRFVFYPNTIAFDLMIMLVECSIYLQLNKWLCTQLGIESPTSNWDLLKNALVVDGHSLGMGIKGCVVIYKYSDAAPGFYKHLIHLNAVSKLVAIRKIWDHEVAQSSIEGGDHVVRFLNRLSETDWWFPSWRAVCESDWSVFCSTFRDNIAETPPERLAFYQHLLFWRNTGDNQLVSGIRETIELPHGIVLSKRTCALFINLVIYDLMSDDEDEQR